MARARRPRRPPAIDFRRMARQFPENGVRLLLESPHNAAELLPLTDSPLVAGLDGSRLRREDTAFVHRDYRHSACDLLYTVPYREPGPGGVRELSVYLLLEHQFLPEDVLPLRVTGYVTEVYRRQAGEWWRRYRSWTGLQLRPVFPVLLHTGVRPWQNPGKLSGIVLGGQAFAPYIPDLEMGYIDLPAKSTAELLTKAGHLGRVLHVLQQRRARRETFAEVLMEEVAGLEALCAEDRGRWLEVLSFLLALVYHERGETEHAELQEAVEASVNSDPERREVREMGRTMAQYLEEKGRIEGERRGQLKGRQQALRETLLRLLEQKFSAVPPSVREVIQGTTNVDQLQGWFDRALSAEALDDVGIGPSST